MDAKELADALIEAIKRRDVDEMMALYSPDAVVFDPDFGPAGQDLASMEKDMRDYFVSIPNLRFDVYDTVVDGSLIAIHGRGYGTILGPRTTPKGVRQPSGEGLDFTYALFLRLNEAGLISEERRYIGLH
jgi:hypothetical protein